MDEILIITADYLPEELRHAKLGSMIFVTHVNAIHVIKDIREQITNVFGGRMTRYEDLLQEGADAAVQKLKEKLSAGNWDGAYAVHFSHPTIVEGGCEIILSGTPFRRA
ncbi:heavy metal-binding domain-containing protein [Rhodospirillum sp. A1_3_36]|uniref:heavy metal-binding domain-containing protein n=1 Tax=Rhodospirillum sp. A1_3_36 TaxID=3391666 RepID=UPI0039A4FCF4